MIRTSHSSPDHLTAGRAAVAIRTLALIGTVLGTTLGAAQGGSAQTPPERSQAPTLGSELPSGLEPAELVEIAVESGGLRIRSSQPIQGITAMTDDRGRPQILLPGHRLAPHLEDGNFDTGWLSSLELRSDRGDSLDFVRLSLTPRQQVRYRLQTAGDTAWVQIADSDGRWLPVGKEHDLPTNPAEAELAAGADIAATVSSTTVQAARATTATATEPDRVRTTRGVNLRAGPGVSTAILQGVPAETDLVALERRDGWVRVELESSGKIVGWIFGQYLAGVARE